MADEKKRLGYMDIAKGIGIIWVLIGHTYDGFLRDLAFSFHMPLFFLISGFFFEFEENKNAHLKKNLKSLILPYWFIVGLWTLYSLITNPDKSDCLQWILGGLYGSGMGLTQPISIRPIYGLWFFWALFWARVILNCLDKLPEPVRAVIVFALGYWGTISYPYFCLPFDFQNGCLSMVFVYIGYLLRKYQFFDKLHNHIYVYIIFAIVWINAANFGYGFISIVSCSATMISGITSCFGAIVVIGISRALESVKIFRSIFEWIGRRTMIFFAFHIFELHSGICDRISSAIFQPNNLYITFAVRCTFCACIALLLPNVPYIRNIFGFKRNNTKDREAA